MKYLHEDYFNPDPIVVETYDYPKSRVKVGDIILPEDGSWALVIKDDRLVNEAIAYRPKRTNWKVLATEGRFPTGSFNDLPDDKLIVTPGMRLPGGQILQWNDLMICRLTDGAIGFIRSDHVSIHKTASFFPAECNPIQF